MVKENVNEDLTPKEGKSGKLLPKYKGTMLFDDRDVEVVVWECIDKNGKPYIRVGLKDAVAAEQERHEYRMAQLRNRSEVPESRDELAEKPDRTEKTQPSKRRRKVA
jgi:uncharacterized protein (DUF736 family)